jgi:endoglucanase
MSQPTAPPRRERRPSLLRRIGTALLLAAVASGGAVAAAPVASAAPPAGTPAAVNGQLHVCRVNLCNQAGTAIQLRGMSSHGLQWFGSCYNATTLGVLANDWKSDLFRIAMYVQEGGYETNPAGFTSQVNTLVDQAEAAGMYALIDFHTLTPGDPNHNTANAKKFFADVSARNAAKTNVIYEIANEPNGVTWSQIKNYADQVIPVIRANDPDAVIIVGTPGWSSLGVSGGGSYQDVVANRIADANTMYAFHLYAASHGDTYRTALSSASASLPMFVTEWGTVQATGGGAPDLASSDAWLRLLDSRKISYANWNYADGNETSAAFTAGHCGAPGTTYLTQSGAYLRSRISTPDAFGSGTGGTPADTTAPSAPTGLRVTGTTSASVSLSWTASTDAVGVTGYDVYRGATKVGSATTTSYTNSGLAASTGYSYTVRSRDAAGNVSAASTAVTGTTAAAGGTTTPPPTTPTGSVKVQYKNNDASTTDNGIRPGLRVVNTGSATLDLSTVTMRYWFTRDGGPTTFGTACDYAAVGCANVRTRVVMLPSPVNGADAYLEVSFTGGTVAAGRDSGDVQVRVNKSDWSTFAEVGDHSHATNTAYADAPRVAAYVGGALAWGSPAA